MTELYLVRRDALADELKRIIGKRAGDCEILKTPNGKPYIAGNPFYISLAHSGDRAAFAISEREVGVDLEVFSDKPKGGILSRFSAREREEIRSDADFFIHWTAREAYVKMLGATLWEYIKRLEYYGGEIYVVGIKQNICARVHRLGYGAACVCTRDN